MKDTAELRAVAVFRPTGPSAGFLQPVFAGSQGDNQSYIQIIRNPEKIERFEAIVWPERDYIMLDEELTARNGEESIWGFEFEEEPPIIMKWSQFRDEMQKHIDGGRLADKPLLQFDIVDTLNLTRLKPSVFTRAFHRYRSLSSETADRWRERAILEPALLKAVHAQFPASKHQWQPDERNLFRARIDSIPI